MSLRCCAKCDYVINNRHHSGEGCPECGSNEMRCPIEDTRDWNKMYQEQKYSEKKDIFKNIKVSNDYNYPFFEIGSWFSIWKQSIGFGITLCETSPYAPDGSVPLVFFDIGYIQIMIESPRLYKYFYKRKYNEELDI